jgi:hypothetical protein
MDWDTAVKSAAKEASEAGVGPNDIESVAKMVAARARCFDELADAEPGSEGWTRLMAEIVHYEETLDRYGL